ncbi:DNA-binding transcriptional activator of the SARP family [Asanoa ishikariensis]|uniref:DNA-binding transcriptional activator of the SARP family n=1 Tax=Asanoa ishikariensis TaxID=137265 RepID=A0A1H3TL97_9ACTN|nr:DNA-binding transcriptional activator of the SARP family [Asanoa ishikariensis]
MTVDGVARPVPGLRRKGVLAVLALHAGTIVSVDRLVHAIWDEHPPATALNTLQRHMSYLRHVFGARDTIVARSPGYVLELGSEATDAAVAERLVRQAQQSEDWIANTARLRAALALWRGPALVDVAGLRWMEEQSRRLTLLEEEARYALIEARLVLGEHAELVPELARLTAEQPYHENVHAQLMLALYRAGRQADALEAYQVLRRALREDLGIEPSAALRDLQTNMLRHDPTLDPPGQAVAGSRSASKATVPSQLPLAVRTFVGREPELARLDATLTDTEQAQPAAVVISALSGTAGIGKTALALHWAHRVAAQFPDGQLYVNLRGFDAGGSVLDPAAALRSFLDALNVPAHRIPATLDDQASLYRSLLAGKRVLVVLDNARDVAQIRPLLPGSGGCVVVVTSRRQLTALVATEGAHPLTLDLLTPAQARDLMSAQIGKDRVAAEPAAVDEIIERCARLPLALALAAARAATRPHLPLSGLAAELRDAGALAPFDRDDATADLRAVFSWSYSALRPDVAHLFRLLGLARGPYITADAAASLAGLPLAQVRTLLTELTDVNLLSEHAPGRYTFHDLLRAYAAEQADQLDDNHIRRPAVHRMLDHYLHSAHPAAQLLDPHLVPIDPAPVQPHVIVQQHNSHHAALSWFSAEYTPLLAAIDHAAEIGFEQHPWQLASTVSTFLLRQGLWQQHTHAHSTALAAARRLGHRAGQAHALFGLGIGNARAGRFDEAHPQLEQALDLFGKLDHRIGAAVALETLAWISERRNRPADALRDVNRALSIVETTSHRGHQARFLNDLGWFHSLLGDHHQAVAHCEKALAIGQELGDVNGQAATWDSLGYAHRQLRDYPRAIRCYQQAVDLYRELADAYNQAVTLADFGDTHQDAGDADAARLAWREALRILTQIDHPDADDVRARLDRESAPEPA